MMSIDFKVAKLGSEVMCSQDGIEQEVLNDYAAGLVERHGAEGLIMVASGAVKAGIATIMTTEGTEALRFYKKPTLASIGNVMLMQGCQIAFEEAGVRAGAIITTHAEINDPVEGHILRETFGMNAERGVVSVVNNNDANSRDELASLDEAKDNDRMGIHICGLVGASVFEIFTAGGGVYDDEGQLIPKIDSENYDEVMYMLALRQSRGAGKSDSGTGGIASKVATAQQAARAGIKSFIAAPNEDMSGENVTRFVW